jgi:hypothetical protein
MQGPEGYTTRIEKKSDDTVEGLNREIYTELLDTVNDIEVKLADLKNKLVDIATSPDTAASERVPNLSAEEAIKETERLMHLGE